MKFLIISHAEHKLLKNECFSYAPYVREMNLWLKYVDEVEIVAPLVQQNISNIDLAYNHENLKYTQIPSIAFTSVIKAVLSLLKLPLILFTLFKACCKADHIHLRCPGNIGLLGCFVQILFPKKCKTAKYAGNWDSKSKQPLSYKLQKAILSNTFFTKNCKMLVYGEWPNQTKNVKSFFTASYSKNEIENNELREYSKVLNFVFVGSLVKGKRPLEALKVVECLKKKGKQVKLDVYGDGILRKEIESYIRCNNLENVITLHGNQKKEVVKKSLRKAHFLILLSKSEGWPKAVAEAMFFGVIPIVTPISCVPYMLNGGERGILVEPEANMAAEKLCGLTNQECVIMSNKAMSWSQYYTLDRFETEIQKLLVR